MANPYASLSLWKESGLRFPEDVGAPRTGSSCSSQTIITYLLHEIEGRKEEIVRKSDHVLTNQLQDGAMHDACTQSCALGIRELDLHRRADAILEGHWLMCRQLPVLVEMYCSSPDFVSRRPEQQRDNKAMS